MSKKSQKKNLNQMELNFPISSQEGSPANRSRSQANKKERVTTDISGQRCFESSKSLSRGGLLEKMSKALLTSKTAWSSRLCALTWKEKDTKSGRSIFGAGVGAPHRRERIWIVAHAKRYNKTDEIGRSDETARGIQEEHRQNDGSARLTSRTSSMQTNNGHEDMEDLPTHCNRGEISRGKNEDEYKKGCQSASTIKYSSESNVANTNSNRSTE